MSAYRDHVETMNDRERGLRDEAHLQQLTVDAIRRTRKAEREARNALRFLFWSIALAAALEIAVLIWMMRS
jgi:hypothetical protein